MSIKQVSKDNFVYFYNDGIISRMNAKTKAIEVRDLITNVWKPTSNTSLKEKMFQGKGIIQYEEMKNLFSILRQRALL